MKVSIIYLNVTASGYPGAAPPEYYIPFSQRWVETYKQFAPGASHELVVVSCGAKPHSEMMRMYEGLECRFETYLGAGSDIGACQDVMKRVDADFVLCMSTPVYFWKSGWLDKIVKARESFGDGLYGPMASYQERPHIRTSCWGVSPKTFQDYPHIIDTREKCCWAEASEHNNEGWQISDWFNNKGLKTMMVTWDEVLSKRYWRTPPNIFRRGDQSNCIVWDQHVDVYRVSHYHDRISLANLADKDLTVKR